MIRGVTKTVYIFYRPWLSARYVYEAASSFLFRWKGKRAEPSDVGCFISLLPIPILYPCTEIISVGPNLIYSPVSLFHLKTDAYPVFETQLAFNLGRQKIQNFNHD
jgi:hypothetical protein